MKFIFGILILTVFLFTPAGAAKKHPCISDAHKQGMKLLRFHYDETPKGEIEKDRTKVLKSFKNPAARRTSKSRFDVIEVWGWVYKAGYRMRLIYNQDNSDGCTLVGQEILDWLPNER